MCNRPTLGTACRDARCGGREDLSLSPDAERALITWTGKFGDPDTL
jgi:hypothetical protein